MKEIIFLSIVTMAALFSNQAVGMSCKKLYTMQDIEANSKEFKDELTTRCNQSVLDQLKKLKEAYDATTNTEVKSNLVKKMMELEDQLEVKQ